jgi:hypothetical protein
MAVVSSLGGEFTWHNSQPRICHPEIKSAVILPNEPPQGLDEPILRSAHVNSMTSSNAEILAYMIEGTRHDCL